jgi:hypothetical protein
MRKTFHVEQILAYPSPLANRISDSSNLPGDAHGSAAVEISVSKRPLRQDPVPMNQKHNSVKSVINAREVSRNERLECPGGNSAPGCQRMLDFA